MVRVGVMRWGMCYVYSKSKHFERGTIEVVRGGDPYW